MNPCALGAKFYILGVPSVGTIYAVGTVDPVGARQAIHAVLTRVALFTLGALLSLFTLRAGFACTAGKGADGHECRQQNGGHAKKYVRGLSVFHVLPPEK